MKLKNQALTTIIIFIAQICLAQSDILIAKACMDGKCGFIDTSGNFLIQPKFSDARDFSEGLAAVKQNLSWGYIDTKGEFVIKPNFAIARNFNNGRACVFKEGHWIFINYNGKEIISGFDAMTDFNDGYAAVKKNLKWGIINTEGEIIVPLVHNHMRIPNKGKAIIRDENKYGFINLKNELIIENKFDLADQFFEGLAKVGNLEGIGYIDTLGNWVFKIPQKPNNPTFEITYDNGYCSEGRIFIRDSYYNSFAIFDSIGNKLTGYNFRHYHPFSEGLAAVEIKNNEWAYVNKNGKIIINKKFLSAREFSNGFAAVKLNKKDGANIYKSIKWGYIDKSGKIIIAPKFDSYSKFHNPNLTFPDKFE